MREAERIFFEYERRDGTLPPERYSPADPAQLFARQTRERTTLRLLRGAGYLPLDRWRVLDVGCGNGQALIDFETWGAERGKLAGIDLGPRRIELARRRLAGADLRLGDASELPWPDRSFDLVAQSMVFSSILDETMRSAVAREMMRVLRPGGAVLWYDFFLGNPRNHGLRRMPRATIAALFPGFTLDLRRTTLAPPLARRLAHRHYALPLSVQVLRGLNSHYLGLLRPAVPAPRVRTNRFRSRSADRLATRAGAAAHPPGNGVSALGRVAARFPHHGLAQP